MLIQILRDKINSSKYSLNDIFSTFDKNRQGKITFEEFCEAFYEA